MMEYEVAAKESLADLRQKHDSEIIVLNEYCMQQYMPIKVNKRVLDLRKMEKKY